MTPDHDDPMVARLWRGISSEAPGAPLDAHILQAARTQRHRGRLVPMAAALAACLVLAIYAVQLGFVPQQRTARPDGATFGLYAEGITAVPVNTEATQQRIIRQMPGGSDTSEVVFP